MPHNARDRILVVGQHRAAVEATGIRAMMAGRGDGLLKRLPPVVAEKKTHSTPRFTLIETVQAVTRADAGFAAGTFVEIDFKRVLLPRLRLREGNEVAVILFLRGTGVEFVLFGKTTHDSETLLLGQQFIDQRAVVIRWK